MGNYTKRPAHSKGSLPRFLSKLASKKQSAAGVESDGKQSSSKAEARSNKPADARATAIVGARSTRCTGVQRSRASENFT